MCLTYDVKSLTYEESSLSYDYTNIIGIKHVPTHCVGGLTEGNGRE